jgi:hypothetical protein
VPTSSLGEQSLPILPLSLLSQARLVKHPLTQALSAALSAPYQVNNARRHDLLWEMSLRNFDASYTSSSAADMAFISCGSNTLSRKPMPSPKNGMIVPICGYRFSFVPEMQTPFLGCSSYGFLWNFRDGFAWRRNARGRPRLIPMQWEVGDGAMSKEREYRACAGACVDLANKALNDDDRKHLLAMAEAWLGLADRVQRGVVEPEVDLLHPALLAKLGA